MEEKEEEKREEFSHCVSYREREDADILSRSRELNCRKEKQRSKKENFSCANNYTRGCVCFDSLKLLLTTYRSSSSGGSSSGSGSGSRSSNNNICDEYTSWVRFSFYLSLSLSLSVI